MPSLLPQDDLRGHCRACGTALPEDSDRRRKYCDDACRKRFERQVKKEAEELAEYGYDDQKLLLARPGENGFGSRITETTRLMRRMAIERLDDEVRTEMRQQISETITPIVRDKIYGAANAMAELLPIALAGIAIDLESDDWMIRGRARDALLKYVMPFAKLEAQRAGDGKFIMEHTLVPYDGTGGTPAPVEMVEKVKQLAAEEAGESDLREVDDAWPTCDRCERQLPPGAGRFLDTAGHPGAYPDTPAPERKWVCRTCLAIQNLDRDARRPPRGTPAA